MGRFFPKNPDSQPLNDLLSTDPILDKIYKFASIPDLSLNFKEYPFKEKLTELGIISGEDIAHLNNMSITSSSELIDYIENLYTIVSNTVWLYQAMIEGGKQSHEEVLGHLEKGFRKGISQDKTIIGEENGQKVSKRFIGRWYPFYLQWVCSYAPQGDKPAQVICRFNFPVKSPTPDALMTEIEMWSQYSIESWQRYQEHVENISYGDPSYEAPEYLLEFYQKNKSITWDTPVGPQKQFKFPTRQRYAPLLNKWLGKTIKRYNDIIDEDHIKSEAELLFLSAMGNFDKNSGKPGAYLKNSLKHLSQKLFERHTTTNIPDNPICNQDLSCAVTDTILLIN